LIFVDQNAEQSNECPTFCCNNIYDLWRLRTICPLEVPTGTNLIGLVGVAGFEPATTRTVQVNFYRYLLVSLDMLQKHVRPWLSHP